MVSDQRRDPHCRGIKDVRRYAQWLIRATSVFAGDAQTQRRDEEINKKER